MNLDELKQEFGSAESAAKAVADGTHPINGEDWLSWPLEFLLLVLFYKK